MGIKSASDTINNSDHPRGTVVKTLRWLSAILFIGALAGIGAMLLSDSTRHFQFSPIHQRVAAYPLMLIGLSYISLQLSAPRSPAERIKGVLLGLAFVLWGSEMLLPSSRLVIFMDTAVVSIFVIDLSMIVFEHLRRQDHELP
ncbi:MAG: hypothetical protein ACLQVD_11595 [Capsulimonadaceae bacterium]